MGAGNWRLGELTINRIGFGTKRLGGRGIATGISRAEAA